MNDISDKNYAGLTLSYVAWNNAAREQWIINYRHADIQVQDLVIIREYLDTQIKLILSNK